VKDTGCGIKPDDQKKLFQLFGYLKESRNKNKHGIGLGLVISKQIIE
jgi:signal transduction histidine kinase